MKIGIIEILYHQVFLYSLASVARESGADVTIFTTKKLYNLVIPLFKDKIKNYRWVIKREDESRTSFLKRVEGIVNKEIDLLFVNTIQGNSCYQFYSFNPKCKSILVTGRVTEWFGDKLKLISLHPRSSLHYALQYMARKKILPKYNAVIVHTEALKDYVLANRYMKDIFVFSFAIYDGSTSLKMIGEKLKFVVAGSIAEHRRDYDGLLKAFEEMWSHGYNDVRLTILGRPIGEYGERIINWSRSIKENGFDIQFYNGYIPEEIFNREIMSSDIIVNPIRLQNYQYGCFTAGLVEAIMHAKPGIYPDGYIVPKKLLSSSIFYDKINNLGYLIEQKILNNNGGVLEKLSKKARENSEKFSLENMTKYFRKNILEKCK